MLFRSAINTHVTVSEIHHGVVNTHTVVSGIDHNVTSSHAMVSDIHRTIVQGQDGSGSTRVLVSDSRTLALIE